MILKMGLILPDMQKKCSAAQHRSASSSEVLAPDQGAGGHMHPLGSNPAPGCGQPHGGVLAHSLKFNPKDSFQINTLKTAHFLDSLLGITCTQERGKSLLHLPAKLSQGALKQLKKNALLHATKSTGKKYTKIRHFFGENRSKSEGNCF